MLLFLSSGRQDNAGQGLPLRLRSDFGEDIKAAQMRHHQIEQDDLNIGFTSKDLERLPSVVGKAHPKWPLLQFHLDDTPDVRLVVGDQRVDRLHSKSRLG